MSEALVSEWQPSWNDPLQSDYLLAHLLLCGHGALLKSPPTKTATIIFGQEPTPQQIALVVEYDRRAHALMAKSLG